VYIGAWILFLAREHLDEDAMKIFQAVVRALEQDQEREQKRAGARRANDSAQDNAE
jgi:hypothetical protein